MLILKKKNTKNPNKQKKNSLPSPLFEAILIEKAYQMFTFKAVLCIMMFSPLPVPTSFGKK